MGIYRVDLRVFNSRRLADKQFSRFDLIDALQLTLVNLTLNFTISDKHFIETEWLGLTHCQARLGRQLPSKSKVLRHFQAAAFFANRRAG